MATSSLGRANDTAQQQTRQRFGEGDVDDANAAIGGVTARVTSRPRV